MKSVTPWFKWCRWAVLVAMPLLLSAMVGAFPIPWIDELVFMDSGLKTLATGKLFESYWAAYHPAYAHGLINNPPLYGLLCGAGMRWTPLGLEGLRLLQAGIFFTLLAVILESRRRLWEEREFARPEPETLFLVLASCPYVFRAAGILRPDAFIFLVQMWLTLEIWDGTFLGSRRRSLAVGAAVSAAAWLHYSAILLIPFALVGSIILAPRIGVRNAMKHVGFATLAGLICYGPWLWVFAHQYPVWKQLVAATQEAQKYAVPKTSLDYLWPTRWLESWVPPRQLWAESAWGPSFAYYIWWLSYPLILLLGAGLAWRGRLMSRGILLVVLGGLGTWFFVRYSEMWFALYGLGGAECAIVLGCSELWKGLGSRVGKALIGLQALAAAAFFLSTPVPSWREWHAAERRTLDLLTPIIKSGHEPVYIASLPDVSACLLKKWPDLTITRGIDFPLFAEAYAQLIPRQAAFVISEPWVSPGHPPVPRAALMDWNGALAGFAATHGFNLAPVDAGDYRFWVLTPLASDAKRPTSDAIGPSRPPEP